MRCLRNSTARCEIGQLIVKLQTSYTKFTLLKVSTTHVICARKSLTCNTFHACKITQMCKI